MIKKVLEQYPNLLKEIEKLNKRITKLEEQTTMISDVVQNGYKRHAVIFGVDQVRLNKLTLLRNVLKEREEIALEQRIQIEMFINNIKESDIRQIFEYRYIDNLSWIEIQLEMKYKHEDTARKKHDRYLKKIL